jgi:hypothetical protein
MASPWPLLDDDAQPGGSRRCRSGPPADAPQAGGGGQQGIRDEIVALPPGDHAADGAGAGPRGLPCASSAARYSTGALSHYNEVLGGSFLIGLNEPVIGPSTAPSNAPPMWPSRPGAGGALAVLAALGLAVTATSPGPPSTEPAVGGNGRLSGCSIQDHGPGCRPPEAGLVLRRRRQNSPNAPTTPYHAPGPWLRRYTWASCTTVERAAREIAGGPPDCPNWWPL